jgi:cysteine desulfurase/selenocysteine lyase
MTERIIYFNNAATSWPKPPGVIGLVARTLEGPYHEKGRTTAWSPIDYVEETREKLAAHFHRDDPGNFVFTANATDSLNMLIHGFARARAEPFHVITSALEHNSVLRPLRTLERDGRISLSIAPIVRNHVALEQIAPLITESTALVVLGHGSNVLGSVQDIGRIGAYLRSRGIFYLVDGAQTAGQMDIDLSRSGADAFVFTGHKALFGLPGTGGFWVGSPDMIEPVRQGGTGTDSGYPFQPGEMPLKFETGTPNYPGIISLYAGLGFIEVIGIAGIEEKLHDMTGYLVSGLRDIPGLTLHNPSPELPVISFALDGIECDDVGLILAKAYHIIVRTGLHCAPLVHEAIDGGCGSVRISLSYLNTMEECGLAIDAIWEVAESAGH